MSFNDWWDVLGTGIQSAFAWMGFNRDSFADNVGWRQAQKYQQKNYHISWVAVARDDIRDMMSISVNRLNNFMIVNGLILGVAGSAITSAPSSKDATAFLIAAFLVSVTTSVVFLVLAIMFGIKGQNCAFTRTMRLLTFEMRPENPADYNHDYMKQAQWIEKTGLKQMLRIPGLMPDYKTGKVEDEMLPDHVKANKERMEQKGKYGHKMGHGHRDSKGELVAEDFTALEHLEVSSRSLWYLTKFGNFMTLWMPYDTTCKYAMGMGMLCLGHGGAYFIMATIKAGGWQVDWYAAVGACFAFVYMVALVVMQNFKDEDDEYDAEAEAEAAPKPAISRMTMMKIFTVLVLTLGPTLGVYGSTTAIDWLRKWMWMACYALHCVFWTGTFFLTGSQQVFRDSKLVNMNEDDFWGKDGPQQAHSTKTAGGASGASAAATVVGSGTQPFVSKAETKYEEGISSGSSSDEGSPRGSTYQPGNDTNGVRGYSANSSQSTTYPHVDVPQGSHDASTLAGAGRWPSDEPQFNEKVDRTKRKVRMAFQQTIAVCALVWLALLVWCFVETVIVDDDSPLYRTYPDEQAVGVTWPSPFLRPTRIACPQAASYQLVADDFRIFTLDAGRVAEVPCNLSTRIRDVSSHCSGVCSPVVLQEDNSVFDCRGNVAARLLQTDLKALLIDVYMVYPGRPLNEQRLMVIHEKNKMVQYQWSTVLGGWRPEYQLEVPTGAKGDVKAISTSGSSIAFFFGAQGSENAVIRREVKTMRHQGGPWALSSSNSPLVGGCAYNQARLAMVLPRVPTMFDPARVVRLNLEKTHGAI